MAGTAKADSDEPPIAGRAELAGLTEATADAATGCGGALDDSNGDVDGLAGVRAATGVDVGRALGVDVGVAVLPCVTATATAHSVAG
jgi:hypothetical protein